MEGQRRRPAAIGDPVSKVLDDDDLLIEILLLVGFPTTLVRASAVCRRWLRRVSERAFLCRFRELHPPRLLGFYAVAPFARFIPMQPQLPEVAAIMARASCSARSYPCTADRIMSCRNGSVLLCFPVYELPKLGVHSVLFPERYLAVLPPFPIGDDCSFGEVHSREDDQEGGNTSYMYVLSTNNPRSTIHVYMLQDGVWSTKASATKHLPPRKLDIKATLSANKVYMMAYPTDIIVLDLTTSRFSTIQLPQGVEDGWRDTMLSQANDASGVYLIEAKGLQFRTWLYRRDTWLLVDTIYLHDMCANLGMSYCRVGQIKRVGDNAEFVFFRMGRSILYLDTKCRTLQKVYEMTDGDENWAFGIYPLKMIWPPIFPMLQG